MLPVDDTMVFKCQEDSFLTKVRLAFSAGCSVLIKFLRFKFSTTVKGCTPVDLTVKDKVQKCFQVILEDTIIFPEGGGQVWNLRNAFVVLLIIFVAAERHRLH